MEAFDCCTTKGSSAMRTPIVAMDIVAHQGSPVEACMPAKHPEVMSIKDALLEVLSTALAIEMGTPLVWCSVLVYTG